MPSDAIIAETVNFAELQQALAEAPAETARYVKTPLFRFARRVVRRVKREQLSGRPGIEGGPWKRLKDKNVKGFTIGTDLSHLKAVTKASRILRTHIEGATITARAGGLLFLSRKTGRAGTGTVFARVRSVRIPPRVQFESIWRQEIPKAGEQIQEAMQRALSVALDRRMKALSATVQQLVRL